jgi:hypothetical protein
MDTHKKGREEFYREREDEGKEGGEEKEGEEGGQRERGRESVRERERWEEGRRGREKEKGREGRREREREIASFSLHKYWVSRGDGSLSLPTSAPSPVFYINNSPPNKPLACLVLASQRIWTDRSLGVREGSEQP